MTPEEKKDVTQFGAEGRARVAAQVGAAQSQADDCNALGGLIVVLPTWFCCQRDAPCRFLNLANPNRPLSTQVGATTSQVDDCIARYLWTRQLTLCVLWVVCVCAAGGGWMSAACLHMLCRPAPPVLGVAAAARLPPRSSSKRSTPVCGSRACRSADSVRRADVPPHEPTHPPTHAQCSKMADLRRAGKEVPTSIDDVERMLGTWRQ